MADTNRVLTFHSDAVSDGTLEVVSFEGTERISRLFEFRLELVSKKADIDFTKMLKESCCLGIKQGVQISGGGKGQTTLRIHGVLSAFEQLEKGQNWIRYRAVLVPKLWRTSLNIQSQIYLDKTVKDIIKEELEDAGFTSQDYDLSKLSGSFPKREYTVQYLESDLNFIQRLCEHEGIYYYFEHKEDAEKLVFGNTPEGFVPIQGNAKIPFRTVMGGKDAEGWFAQETVQSFTCRQHMIPKEVLLKDYNYRMPSVDLKVTCPVDSDGTGTVYLFGEHYKDEGEGKRYAEIRSQEFLCRKKVFQGTGDARAFRSGSTFKLSDHYRSDFNAMYIITEVTHRGAQPIEAVTGAGANAAYQNSFTAIPGDAPYRPERLTPKPKVSGVFSAKVDAGGSGDYAEIDDHGRYKVQIPFDLSGNKGGNASRFIRMAQPYAGGGMGMHFPLHKGTEVILIHTNGDPDRPIIAAAVTNPETTSPVTGGNQTQCAIHTGGGNKMTIEDSAGGQQISIVCPTAGTSIVIGA